MSPAKKAAAPAEQPEPGEVHVDIMPTLPAGLRVVQDGEQAPQPSTEDLVEHYAALAVSAEQAAAELKSEAARFYADADSAKAELRKLLEPGKHPVGNLTISVTEPSRAFDAEAFEKSYPVEVNPALYKSVINTAAVPPNLKDQFMVAGKGERKVSIK